MLLPCPTSHVRCGDDKIAVAKGVLESQWLWHRRMARSSFRHAIIVDGVISVAARQRSGGTRDCWLKMPYNCCIQKALLILLGRSSALSWSIHGQLAFPRKKQARCHSLHSNLNHNKLNSSGCFHDIFTAPNSFTWSVIRAQKRCVCLIMWDIVTAANLMN